VSDTISNEQFIFIYIDTLLSHNITVILSSWYPDPTPGTIKIGYWPALFSTWYKVKS